MHSAQEVGRRAFALALFSWRSGLELGWHDETSDERMAMLSDVVDMRLFLADTRLELALSIGERRRLGKKPGS